ncbi:hypothetical protein EIP91_004249 [Steccherinum ochraceum]|uniref:Uncharacterized protein n=1 Tax=Steccherinum ochraceum TaxID=92696 RepID=A0A4R0RHP4_9APHY|nr:hypothetical protein EIP91_004249 [Steccherinum ochraceum]
MSAASRVLCVSELLGMILTLLPPAVVAAVGQTCHTARKGVSSYTKTAFNVDTVLSLFFNDPRAFRSLLAKTGSVVSGSAALQAAARVRYPGSDLDVYVYCEALANVVQFMTAAGYEYHPYHHQPESLAEAMLPENWDGSYYHSAPHVPGIGTVINLKKVVGGVERSVQLIVSTEDSCPGELILCFHSRTWSTLLHDLGWPCMLKQLLAALVMNVITYNALYCPYPRTVFSEERTVVCNTTGIHGTDGAALDKYRQRGWNVVRPAELDVDGRRSVEESFHVGIVRSFTDRYSWVVPQDMTGVTLPDARTPMTTERTHDPIECASWKMVLGASAAGMRYQVVSSANLEHRYVMYRELEMRSEWISDVERDINCGKDSEERR